MYRVGMGALNCPGDPGCANPDNWTAAEPGSLQYSINQLWDRWNESVTPAIDEIAGAPTVPTGGSSTPVKTSSGISGMTMALAGGGLLLVVLLARAGR